MSVRKLIFTFILFCNLTSVKKKTGDPSHLTQHISFHYHFAKRIKPLPYQLLHSDHKEPIEDKFIVITSTLISQHTRDPFCIHHDILSVQDSHCMNM